MEILNDINFNDILEFWKSFYPVEVNMDEMIHNVEIATGKKLPQIQREYFNNPIQNNKYFKNYKNWLTEKGNYFYIKKCKWFGLYAPIFHLYYKYLQENINASEIITLKDNFTKDVILQICEECNDLSYRTMVLETNIAKNDNILKGKTSIDKGIYFSEVLLTNKEYLQNLYSIYPELIRSLELLIKNKIDFIIQTILNTEKNIKRINESFGPTGALIKVALGKGDTHNGGKSVCKLIFNNNIVIYKPRKMEMENVFYNLIKWLNRQKIADYVDLKACTCINSGDSGWMEYIKYKECENINQIKRFYVRIGELLCLLYVLNGKDMHYENIIAEREYPVIIDLETLLHSEISIPDLKPKMLKTCLNKVIANSVNSIALLPTYIVGKNREDTIDIGGVGFAKPQKAPFKNLFIKNLGTDEVGLIYKYATIYPGQNNPSIKYGSIDTKMYDLQIQAGFSILYKWIMSHQHLFRKKVQEEVAGKKVRHLLKPTNSYSRLLNISYHPDLLHNSIDRYAFLALIRYQQGNIRKQDIHSLREEVHCLYNGDIPYFTTLVDRKELLTSRSNIQEFFESIILEQVEKKIQSLSQEDLDRQLALIEASYRYSDRSKNATPTIFQNNKGIENNVSVRNEYISNIEKIGDLIALKGIYGVSTNNKCAVSWLGVNNINAEVDMIGPVGNDLYDGNAGIALFIAHLFALTNNQKFKNIAYQAIEPLLETLDNFDEFNGEFNIGAFIGGYGWIYAIEKIAIIFHDFSLEYLVKTKAKELACYMKKSICNSDVISGFAGIIGIITFLFEQGIIAQKDFYELIEFLVKKINAAVKIDKATKGYYWGDGYSSYAHGNAGICSQLIKIKKYLKSTKVTNIIQHALNFERGLYDMEKGIWPRRKDSNESQYTWCNGTAGILLSRLEMKKNGYKDDFIDKEIIYLIHECKTKSMKRDMCLCHGDIGNLAILKYAADILGDRILAMECIATGRFFIEHSLNFNRLKQEELWGMMTGLSGVGLGLISLIDNNYAADILSLK